MNPEESPREIRSFRELRASMTPAMWVRAIVLVTILAACAAVGIAVVLALVLGSLLTAIHGVERWDGGDLTAVLVAIVYGSIAHSWI